MCQHFLCAALVVLVLAPTCPADPPQLPRVGEPVVTAAEEEYEIALIAAVHQFAERGEKRHLRAMIAKHPAWVEVRLKFPGPHKPSPGDQYTLLHRAAEKGHLDVVMLLLELKADVQADGGSGWTPLHLAVSSGQLNVVKVLVEVGADVNAATTARPRSPLPSGPPNSPSVFSEQVPAYTPLDLALRGKRDEVVKYLKEKGAKASEK